MEVAERLLKDHEEGRLLLFAGAGLSMNLGLPSWTKLIEHLAAEVDFDPGVFTRLGTYPMLAQYYANQSKGIDGLVEWMRTNWVDDPDIDIHKSEIHRLVAQAKFPIIYTTNYDPWIERAHEAAKRPFSKIVSGPDLVDARHQPYIIKFHGDLDHPPSMVLTEADYFERLSFEHELDIKLRADLQQYSVLFVGYSLSDPNIRLMFHRLSRFREKVRAPHSPLGSYMFLASNNVVQAALLRRWRVEPLVSKELDRTVALETFLRELVLGNIQSVVSPDPD